MSDNQEAESYSRALGKLQSKYDELLKESLEVGKFYSDKKNYYYDQFGKSIDHVDFSTDIITDDFGKRARE